MNLRPGWATQCPKTARATQNLKTKPQMSIFLLSHFKISKSGLELTRPAQAGLELNTTFLVYDTMANTVVFHYQM